jgi:hypothetical protein
MNETLGQGKGMFIWLRRIAENGDIDAIVKRAKQWGLSHVEIKIADGFNCYPSITADMAIPVIAPLIEALAGEGIQVWAWQYIYNLYPELEAQCAGKIINQLRRYITGFLIDAEAECKKRPQAAKPYMVELRNQIGNDFPVGLCSYRFPLFHPELNWKDFTDRSDMWLPQVYWEQAHNPAEQLKQSVTQCLAIKIMPVIPAGSCYHWNGWAPTVDDLNQFDQAVKDAELRGLTWWYWSNVVERQEWIDAITAQSWPVNLTPTKQPTATPEPSAPVINYRIVCPLGMKVREGPGISYNPVGAIAYNQIVAMDQVQKTADTETWGKIQGENNWICIRQGSTTYLVKQQ